MRVPCDHKKNNYLHMKNIFKSLIITAILFTSCNNYEPNVAYKYNTAPNYTWGYAEFYGDYYSEYISDKNVISLSLFSDSLFIEDGSLSGTGQYLFIEDIFIPTADTLLPQGTYYVSDKAENFSFYKGEQFEVDDVKYTVGAYIYYIEKNSAFSKIKFIDKGSFTVINSGDYQKISCNFTLSDNTTLKGTFNNQLPYYNLALTKSSNSPRKKLQLKNPF